VGSGSDAAFRVFWDHEEPATSGHLWQRGPGRSLSVHFVRVVSWTSIVWATHSGQKRGPQEQHATCGHAHYQRLPPSGIAEPQRRVFITTTLNTSTSRAKNAIQRAPIGAVGSSGR
jgi:hypothetical protein